MIKLAIETDGRSNTSVPSIELTNIFNFKQILVQCKRRYQHRWACQMLSAPNSSCCCSGTRYVKLIKLLIQFSLINFISWYSWCGTYLHESCYHVTTAKGFEGVNLDDEELRMKKAFNLHLLIINHYDVIIYYLLYIILMLLFICMLLYMNYYYAFWNSFMVKANWSKNEYFGYE